MKVRALCAAGLVILAATPASAMAGNSIQNRLHRADVALNRAQDAVDDGAEAKVVSSLRGVNRQTALALKATLRMVTRDRYDADIALADTSEQLDTNAQAVTDMLGDATAPMITAIDTTLAAVTTGRERILATIRGLGDLEPDWADALTELADDVVLDLTVAADNYDGLPSDAEDVLSAFVAQQTDAAGAIAGELVTLAEDGDAALDAELLETLAEDAADAADALDSVSGLASANADQVDDAVVKLEALEELVTGLADDAYGDDDDYYWDDDEESYEDEYYGERDRPHPGHGPGPHRRH